MYARVRQLREHGRRRPENAIAADDGVSGKLQGFVVEGYAVMHLYQWAAHSAQMPDLISPLYQPQIVGLRDLRMFVRGWQRDSNDQDAATTLQEWSVEFLTERPPV